MEEWVSVRRSLVGVMLVLGTVALMGGCATKKYVRTQVDTSAHELSARIDNGEQTIKTTQGQIGELNDVTRTNTQKITSLDTGLKQTDSKAQQALSTGESAQNTAGKAVQQVSALEDKFLNRNRYVVLNEEQVKFKFDSAKLTPDSKTVLDDLAQQMKQNTDVILVMEGHTDSAGSADYNVLLGQKRLEAVTRYLVVEKGVPMNHISDLSFGKDKPMADNKTKEGRAQNRAVVMRVMGPQLTGKEAVAQAKPEEETQ